ncbi:hypothetical protein HYALB_00013024 [Hymenoscyphus albidus]|uniref:Uncharacterized protein n=1 Tax=Hymenoscyphus albidus TaxID=595503 RepID=A0A9N9LV92_9HELO|nr:hypothetical protein HYALB_00013024 [Hymenoscyphus albidus]
MKEKQKNPSPWVGPSLLGACPTPPAYGQYIYCLALSLTITPLFHQTILKITYILLLLSLPNARNNRFAMDSSPGAFILIAASAAEQVVVGLCHFKYQYRVEEFASQIAFIGNFLSTAGKEVNENPKYFKESFDEKFGGFTQKCKSKFEIILAALEKARSYKKGFGDAREDVCEVAEPPKKPWDRLQWGLGMNDEQIDKFEEDVQELAQGAGVLMSVVSLIVLQKTAQGRDLTPSERTLLTEMKKKMKKILCGLRNTEIASLMSFSLRDNIRAANTVQITKQEDTEKGKKADDASSSSTLCNSKENPTECKLGSDKKLSTSTEKTNSTAKETPPLDDEVIFEMYRAYNGPFKLKRQQSNFRLFGIFQNLPRRARSGTSPQQSPYFPGRDQRLHA